MRHEHSMETGPCNREHDANQVGVPVEQESQRRVRAGSESRTATRSVPETEPPLSEPAGSAKAVALACGDVSKDFEGTHALVGGSIEVRRGEVHALVGENGAGKSTLVKVLAGVIERDSGWVTVGQEHVGPYFGVKWATDHGVRSVHQDQP